MLWKWLKKSDKKIEKTESTLKEINGRQRETRKVVDKLKESLIDNGNGWFKINANNDK